MQAAIPPDIRAKMDADRARAESERDAKPVTVWLLEAPAIPGYYLRATPRITGKLGAQTEVGTPSAHEALRFRRRRMAEEYMRQNPHPAWTPTEHIFDSPNKPDEERPAERNS